MNSKGGLWNECNEHLIFITKYSDSLKKWMLLFLAPISYTPNFRACSPSCACGCPCIIHGYWVLIEL